MAINIKDRIKQGTNTTGAGTVTLHVSYSTSGFQDFSVLGDNAQTYYAIEESPNKFEVGLGTYSGNTLSRDTIFSSSNSNNPVSLGGSGLVFVTYPAEKAVIADDVNVVSVTGVSVGATGVVFSDGSIQTTASSSSSDSYDFWTITDGDNPSNISSSGNVKITGAGEVTVSVSSGSPNVVTVSGASADLSSYATTSNLAATGATNAAAIINNTSNISSNTSAIASTGATNASAISSNTSNISTNTSNIASTGATNAAAISSNTSNIASTGFTNASGISANTASISSNTSNIASTGATNASGITSNTSSISSNTSNIAATGATNASGITANTSSISSNTSNIASTGSTLVSQIAATGATNAAAIASKDNYQYWTLKGDSSTTTNIDSTETVQITGAGNVSVSLGGSDDRIVTVSGADQDLSSYATTSYVGTVSGDLNTKINNNIYTWNATGVYGASSTGVTLSQGDSLTVSGASGVSVNLTAGTPNKFVVSHDDTSSAGSVTVTPNNFITSVKLDTYGHVTGLGYAEVTGVGSGAGGGGGSYSFTVSDGVSGEAVPSGGTVTWSGGGATTVSYNTGTNTFLVNTPSSESSYTQWVASDGANTSNVENNNQVRITGAGNTTVTLASGSTNVFTISGTDQDLSSYATVSNLASTGATNAAAAATNAGNISTNTSNIASTGATNASAAATNSSNISTNLSTINTIKASGLYIPTAGTGLQLVGNAINVSGIDSTMIVNGSVLNADLANSTVSYGGVTLSLGGSDATPAFNLSDATGYPTGVIATSIANTGATNAASAATNADNISTNTSNIASTGATNAAAAATNASNISTNTSNIASTGATNAAAAASNASNISTNTSNIASTGATNASAASTNAGNITTNLNSINTIKASGLYIPTAGTGLQLVGNEFNVSGIDSSMIVNGSVANEDLANSSVTVTAGTGLSNGGAVSLGSSITIDADTATTSQVGVVQLQDSATDGTTDKAITPNAVYDISGALQTNIDGKDNYTKWVLQGDGATTTDIDSAETVQFTGAGNVSISLGGTDNRTVTISGNDVSNTYTAGTGLALVGTEFSTSGTGTFTQINFDLDATPSYNEGTIFYDNENKALAVYNDEADITLQVGQEAYVRVRNNTADTISNGQAVYITGAHGNAAPAVDLSIATGEATSQVIGLATHSIEANSFGYVTTFGVVRDVDTSLFNAGDSVYVSEAVSGGLTGVSPVIPNYKAPVGHIIRSHASNGTILVQIVAPKLGGGDAKVVNSDINISGIPFYTVLANQNAGGMSSDPAFVYDSGNNQLQLGSGVQLLNAVPGNTTNALYNNGGTLYFNGSAVDSDTTYTAGTGLQLVGTEFNVSGIDSSMIVDGSVANGDLANDSVTVTAGSGLSNGGEVDLGATITLDITPGGVTNDMLGGSIANAKLANSSVTVTAGDALTGGGAVSLGGSVSLAVGVDNSSIEINSDAVRVKAGGVTAAMLNSDVTLDEITDHGATTTNNITVGTTTTSGILTPLISGSGASTATFDLSTASTFTYTIDETTTLALSNVTDGQKFMIRLKQDQTGSRAVNWFSTIYWAEGGTAPTLTTTAYHSDVFGFLCTTSGYYEGFVIGQNISGA